jgi:hypothetical protein
MSVTNHTIVQTRVLSEKLTAIHLVKELIFFLLKPTLHGSTDMQLPLVPVRKEIKFHSL